MQASFGRIINVVVDMEVTEIKDRESGKRAFILANGPSVNTFDLSLLRDEVTIGMNASSILQDKYGFCQNYYTVSDERFLRNPEKMPYATSMINERTIRVFRSTLKRDMPRKYLSSTVFVEALEMFGFSFNLENGYYFGRTTTMLAIQLAYYLGCNEIYLLGVDLNYSGIGKRFYHQKVLELDDATASVQIHSFFHSYQVLKEKGVHLFNCSKESLLRNYIPYRDFESLFI